jgi:hypothetical protein
MGNIHRQALFVLQALVSMLRAGMQFGTLRVPKMTLYDYGSLILPTLRGLFSRRQIGNPRQATAKNRRIEKLSGKSFSEITRYSRGKRASARAAFLKPLENSLVMFWKKSSTRD